MEKIGIKERLKNVKLTLSRALPSKATPPRNQLNRNGHPSKDEVTILGLYKR